MKKVFSCIFALLTAFGLLLPTQAAQMNSYTIEELNMQLNVPSAWITFTRTVDERDPNLKLLNRTAKQQTDSMIAQNIYFNSMQIQPFAEIVVTMSESEASGQIFTFSEYESGELIQISEEFIRSAGTEQSGVSYTNQAIYEANGIQYILLDFSMQAGDAVFFGQQYYTVINGQSISIIIRSGTELTEELKNTGKAAVDSIIYTQILPNPSPRKEQNPFLAYTAAIILAAGIGIAIYVYTAKRSAGAENVKTEPFIQAGTQTGPAADKNPPAFSERQAETQSASIGNICPSCRHINEADADICGRCASELPANSKGTEKEKS